MRRPRLPIAPFHADARQLSVPNSTQCDERKHDAPTSKEYSVPCEYLRVHKTPTKQPTVSPEISSNLSSQPTESALLFKRRSHLILLVSEMWNLSNGIDW